MPKKKVAKRVPSKTSAASGEELESMAAVMGMDVTEWEATEVAKGGGFPVGKGQTCIIEDVEVTQTKDTDRMMIAWTLKGTSEGIEDIVDWKNDVMRSKQSLTYLRRDMEAIGLEWPSNPQELGEALQPALGSEITVDVVDKDEYHNIYFRDLISSDGAAAVAPATDTPAEEPDDPNALTRADLETLGTDADGEDESAIDGLTEYAKDAGLDVDDYPDTWTSLAEALMETWGL